MSRRAFGGLAGCRAAFAALAVLMAASCSDAPDHVTSIRGETVEGRVSEGEICVGSGSGANFGSTCVTVGADGGVLYQVAELGEPAVSTLIIYLAGFARSVEITRAGQAVDVTLDGQFVSAVLGSQRDVMVEVRWADGGITSVDLADLVAHLGEPGSTAGGVIAPDR